MIKGGADKGSTGPAQPSGSMARKDVGSNPDLCHFLVVWAQANNLTSLSLSFLIYKMDWYKD